MTNYAQNQDERPQAPNWSQIRRHENTSKRTAWRPLRVPMFRNLLIADLMSEHFLLALPAGALGDIFNLPFRFLPIPPTSVA